MSVWVAQVQTSSTLTVACTSQTPPFQTSQAGTSLGWSYGVPPA
eukprot:CAMPEP_0204117950 /NCGR_PEP_ID=MMETSP0361-20130328/6272_1 /ASSEMBLY_ACC=CAM_ASM_000343 /TAXON_ID=268821 /ORGANISM="Scrippsiella Hangoei, Strain SHTV-5" /LENGTH=43 /DNA_ID= /DNA_START= /DNA_END= /DNA_ORIENTATION=